MVDELDEYEDVLRDLIRQSGQSRYERIAPSSDSIEGIANLRDDLLRWIESEGENAHACELLSCVDETLLKFESAKNWLSKKCELLGKTSKKDRKRMAILSQQIVERETLPLPPEVESDLLSFLESQDWTLGGLDLSNSLVANWLDDNIHSLAIRDSTTDFFEMNGLDSSRSIYNYLMARRTEKS